MRTKLATICVLIALAAASPASAENLVDHSGEDPTTQSGSIMDVFKFMKSPTSNEAETDSHGCGPIINAAGDPVYVRREGCPRS